MLTGLEVVIDVLVRVNGDDDVNKVVITEADLLELAVNKTKECGYGFNCMFFPSISKLHGHRLLFGENIEYRIDDIDWDEVASKVSGFMLDKEKDNENT